MKAYQRTEVHIKTRELEMKEVHNLTLIFLMLESPKMKKKNFMSVESHRDHLTMVLEGDYCFRYLGVQGLCFTVS